MVCLDLERYGDAEHRRSKQKQRPSAARGKALFHRLAISEYERGKHPGQERNSLHLGVMPDLDNLYVVRAECNGNGTSGGYERTHTQRKQQEESAQKRNEKIRGRTLAGKQQIIDRLHQVALGGTHYRRRGHSGKHGARPHCAVVGVIFVPYQALLRHAHPAGDVSLIDDFSRKDVGNKCVAQHKEAEHYACYD